jgi:hypothetical protein
MKAQLAPQELRALLELQDRQVRQELLALMELQVQQAPLERERLARLASLVLVAHWDITDHFLI